MKILYRCDQTSVFADLTEQQKKHDQTTNKEKAHATKVLLPKAVVNIGNLLGQYFTDHIRSLVPEGAVISLFASAACVKEAVAFLAQANPASRELVLSHDGEQQDDSTFQHLFFRVLN